MDNTKTNAVTTAPQGGAMQPADIDNTKKELTEKVIKRITSLTQGGLSLPAGFIPENEIRLAFLRLATMETRDRKPLMSVVTSESVANALLEMCIKGLSLYKKQCDFIQYGNTVRLQPEYHGNIAMAKRYGADEPQAQVIYEGDEFEYHIDPATGKTVIDKHLQKLENIKKDKIVGAWCIVPYANHPEIAPKVDIMTMAEIRQSWMQGATKGQSPAHVNFPAEMCKKTVTNRAVKLFISTSIDDGASDPTPAPSDVEDQLPEIIDKEERNSKAIEIDLPGPEADPEPEPQPAPRRNSVPAGAADFDPDFFKAE